MTNLQELTERIQTLIPEIMELKFGCRVHAKNNTFEEYVVIQSFLDGSRFYGYDEEYDDIPRDETLEPEVFKTSAYEILGRDINLEDVLRACSAKYRSGSAKISVNAFGRLLVWEDLDDFKSPIWIETQHKWTLSQPLHKQEEATIDFLHNLICTK